MSKGYVYILTNPALREVDAVVNGKKVKVEPVKIGMTKDVAKRLGVLNTSTPENFVDRLIVELASERDALVLENMVHEKLEDYRIMTAGGGSTEFFNCSVEVAKETVRRLAKKLHFELVNYKRINCEMRTGNAIARELTNRESKKAVAKSVMAKSAELSVGWKNATQLAKAIVEKYNGGKSKGNLWHILNRNRPVAPDSKWRSILEGIGLTFDKDNLVVDWRTVKMGDAVT